MIKSMLDYYRYVYPINNGCTQLISNKEFFIQIMKGEIFVDIFSLKIPADVFGIVTEKSLKWNEIKKKLLNKKIEPPKKP